MRAVTAVIAVVVLGAGCTGDRAVTEPDEPVDATTSPAEQPRCEATPGGPPEGFILVRSRVIRYQDHIGVREEYRDQEDRLLVYLLGVTGEMGEGATIADDVRLTDGTVATLFGTEGTDAWSVVWSDDLPCPQMAVVGNGFGRDEFVSELEGAGILARSSR